MKCLRCCCVLLIPERLQTEVLTRRESAKNVEENPGPGGEGGLHMKGGGDA